MPPIRPSPPAFVPIIEPGKIAAAMPPSATAMNSHRRALRYGTKGSTAPCVSARTCWRPRRRRRRRLPPAAHRAGVYTAKAVARSGKRLAPAPRRPEVDVHERRARVEAEALEPGRPRRLEGLGIVSPWRHRRRSASRRIRSPAGGHPLIIRQDFAAENGRRLGLRKACGADRWFRGGCARGSMFNAERGQGASPSPWQFARRRVAQAGARLSPPAMEFG